MCGSTNPFIRICLGIVQKKPLSFYSNRAKSPLNPLSFSSKLVTIAPFPAPTPYRFSVLLQNPPR